MLLLTLALILAEPSHQASICTLPDGFQMKLELALTNEERATGLMFRDHLEPDWGMLFVFDTEGYWPFWMKNTLIPLDMLWLDRDGVVVEIKSPVEPCRLDPCPSFTPTAPGRAVLEMGAGVAARHGVKVGSRLKLTGVFGFPVPPPQAGATPPATK